MKCPGVLEKVPLLPYDRLIAVCFKPSALAVLWILSAPMMSMRASCAVFELRARERRRREEILPLNPFSLTTALVLILLLIIARAGRSLIVDAGQYDPRDVPEKFPLEAIRRSLPFSCSVKSI